MRSISPKTLAKRKALGQSTYSTFPASRKALKGGGKLRAVGKSKAKRVARNAAYYRSPEWRDVKKRTHEVDGFQCRKMREQYDMPGTLKRCENRGEIVNGKQTARGACLR